MRSTVVVGYDRTLSSGRALLEAGREAAYRGADVTVVHAYHPRGDGVSRAGTAAADPDEAAATAVFGAGILHHHYPDLAVRAEALTGVPHEVLAGAARTAGLLVLGNAGDGAGIGQPLGSVTEQTLERTPCPTMVVRGAERHPRGIVLAAIDLGDRAEEVMDFAFAEARFHSARLHAVSALEPADVHALVGAAQPLHPRVEAQAELDRLLEGRQLRCARVRAGGEVVVGRPTSVLTAEAARADLVVAGSRRRDGKRYGVQIGPVADALLHGAPCPVIIVPHF